MIFSELYGAYYNAVAEIIREALKRPLSPGDLYPIVENGAFGESVLNIAPAIVNQRWQILLPDGTTPLKHPPTMPLTHLQKRWLKAVSLDPRVKLFGEEFPELEGIEPLFTPEDYIVYDKYADGDDYTDETYIRHFRFVLDAVKNHCPIRVDMNNRHGGITRLAMLPEYIEYSEKDDKFRLVGSGNRYGNTVNIARIADCRRFSGEFEFRELKYPKETQTVIFELTDERNALERVLLHFSHFEKQAQRLDDKHYRVAVTYDPDDETEMVIRILSFGPMIKVTEPERFVGLIRERLKKQAELIRSPEEK